MQQKVNLGYNPSNVGQGRRSVESCSRSCTRKRTPSPRKCSLSREHKVSLPISSSSMLWDSQGSQSIPKHTSSIFERRSNFKNIPQGEFRKERPLTHPK